MSFRLQLMKYTCILLAYRKFIFPCAHNSLFFCALRPSLHCRERDEGAGLWHLKGYNYLSRLQIQQGQNGPVVGYPPPVCSWGIGRTHVTFLFLCLFLLKLACFLSA